MPASSISVVSTTGKPCKPFLLEVMVFSPESGYKFKVIVERPRLVNSNGYSRDGRKFRNDENTPGRLGMKRGYTRRPKWLNENLAPL